MASFADLLLLLRGDTSDLDKKLASAQKELKSFSSQTSQLGSALSGLGARLTAAVTLPLAGIATAGIRAFGEIDSLKRGLIAVAGSAERAEQQFIGLREVAKLPGLGLKEAVQGSINLQSLGFSAEKSQRILQVFGNALATVGRGKDDLQETIRQLGQLGSRGVVTADNLRPLIERVPQLATIIKKSFGPEAIGNPGEVFKKLGISSEEFIDKVTSELAKLPPVTGGIKNAIENFSDSSNIAFARIGETLAPAVTEILKYGEQALGKVTELATAFSKLPLAVQEAGLAIAGLAAVGGPGLIFLGQVLSAMSNISAVAAKLLPTMTTLATVGLKAAPWVALAAGIAYAGDKLIEFGARVDTESEKQKKLLESITATRGNLKSQPIVGDDVIERLRDFGKSFDQVKEKVDGPKGLSPALKELTVDVYGPVNPLTQLREAIDAAFNADHLKTIRDVADGIKDIGSQSIFSSKVFKQWSIDALEAESDARALADTIRDLPIKGRNLTPYLVDADSAMKSIGKTSQESRQHFADLTLEVYRQISALHQIGAATAKDVEDAYEAYREASERVLGDVEKKTEKSVKTQESAWKSLGRQVSTIFTDLSRGIAQVIVGGESIGKVFATVGKEISTAIIRFAIERGTDLLIGQLEKILLKSKSINSVILNTAGVFSSLGRSVSDGGFIPGVTDAASTGANAARIGTSAAGSGGGAAGAVGGAVSGVAGIVTAAASVGSLISGIIGNFQFAGMNKSLDLIEASTRYAALYLGGRSDQGILGQLFKLNEEVAFGTSAKSIYFDIAPTLRSIRDALAGGAKPGTSGGGVTINGPITIEVSGASSPRDTAQAIMDTLRLVSPKFAPQ